MGPHTLAFGRPSIPVQYTSILTAIQSSSLSIQERACIAVMLE